MFFPRVLLVTHPGHDSLRFLREFIRTQRSHRRGVRYVYLFIFNGGGDFRVKCLMVFLTVFVFNVSRNCMCIEKIRRRRFVNLFVRGRQTEEEGGAEGLVCDFRVLDALF